MKNLSLKIGWLYPDLMNTYGDRGNIIVLTKRAELRGIKINVEQIYVSTQEKKLMECDMLFMGGAQDTQQEIVNRDLQEKKGEVLTKKILDDTPGLYICGAYQFLGKYYKTADEKKLEGLGVFPLHTENPGIEAKRIIGNVLVRPNTSALTAPLIGFENHGGRTYLENENDAFATVTSGNGNNDQDKTEGIIYKTSIGTYLHGPLLPKNPELADWLLRKALEKKYGKSVVLKSLDDSLEEKAREQTLQLHFS